MNIMNPIIRYDRQLLSQENDKISGIAQTPQRPLFLLQPQDHEDQTLRTPTQNLEARRRKGKSPILVCRSVSSARLLVSNGQLHFRNRVQKGNGTPLNVNNLQIQLVQSEQEPGLWSMPSCLFQGKVLKHRFSEEQKEKREPSSGI